jgi:hypothetical protein
MHKKKHADRQKKCEPIPKLTDLLSLATEEVVNAVHAPNLDEGE